MEMIDFANELQKLLENRISSAEFLRKYQNATGDIRELFINLEHYLSDEDIREKDVKYKNMQENELRKMISKIKSGKSIEKLKQINFLSESYD